MSSFILKRSRNSSSFLFQNPSNKSATLNSSQPNNLIYSSQNHTVFHSGFSTFLLNNMKNPSSSYSTLSRRMHRNLKDMILASGFSVLSVRSPSGSNEVVVFPRGCGLFGTWAAVEPSTSDGLTVDGIVANNWAILDESESDWKSHAAAIAQSIQVIKRRLQVCRSSYSD